MENKISLLLHKDCTSHSDHLFIHTKNECSTDSVSYVGMNRVGHLWSEVADPISGGKYSTCGGTTVVLEAGASELFQALSSVIRTEGSPYE